LFDESRFSDFNELKSWLRLNGVIFSEKTNGVDLKIFFITDLLKVYFKGSEKGYQYNLEGIKERIIKDFSLQQ